MNVRFALKVWYSTQPEESVRKMIVKLIIVINVIIKKDVCYVKMDSQLILIQNVHKALKIVNILKMILLNNVQLVMKIII